MPSGSTRDVNAHGLQRLQKQLHASACAQNRVFRQEYEFLSVHPRHLRWNHKTQQAEVLGRVQGSERGAYGEWIRLKHSHAELRNSTLCWSDVYGYKFDFGRYLTLELADGTFAGSTFVPAYHLPLGQQLVDWKQTQVVCVEGIAGVKFLNGEFHSASILQLGHSIWSAYVWVQGKAGRYLTFSQAPPQLRRGFIVESVLPKRLRVSVNLPRPIAANHDLKIKLRTCNTHKATSTAVYLRYAYQGGLFGMMVRPQAGQRAGFTPLSQLPAKYRKVSAQVIRRQHRPPFWHCVEVRHLETCDKFELDHKAVDLPRELINARACVTYN